MKFVTPAEAFGVDVKVGVQLNDEEAIVVPDCPECPECPPVEECVVECRGWDVIEYDLFTNQTQKEFHDADFTSSNYTIYVFMPQGEWCRHKRRFVLTAGTLGTLGTHYDVDIASNTTDGETAFGFTTLIGGGFMTNCGTLNYQIDLTDAQPGSETWTDICPTVTVCRQVGFG